MFPDSSRRKFPLDDPIEAIDGTLIRWHRHNFNSPQDSSIFLIFFVREVPDNWRNYLYKTIKHFGYLIA